jgi:hypothetical protein
VDLITRDRFPPSGSISFNSQELLALGMAGIDAAAPGAIQHPELSLAHNAATATAVIDFDRLRQTSLPKDSSDAWLYKRILTGEHPISVSVEITSGGGQMTVHPTAVSVSGVTLSGSGLEFLINSFLVPRYPDAVIDRPFPLSPNIDRIEVEPGRATVFRKKK